MQIGALLMRFESRIFALKFYFTNDYFLQLAQRLFTNYY